MKRHATRFTKEEDALILKYASEYSHNLTYGFTKLATSGEINRDVRSITQRYYRIRDNNYCFITMGSKTGTVNRKNVWRGRERGNLIGYKQVLKGLKKIVVISN